VDFYNDYEDATKAGSYAKLEFPGTYYLAFRDLPEIIKEHAQGTNAVDFGCGAGRSTRFLRRLGWNAVGIDISPAMLAQARAIDPDGDYRLIREGGFDGMESGTIDLVLSAFTFDNIPARETKGAILSGISSLLQPKGRMVNLVSDPLIYTHEWVSFSTGDYPENRRARSGDRVLIVNTAIDDRRPVADILWSDEAYRDLYREAGLAVAGVYRPLGREEEPIDWVNETRIPPWAIYVLKKE